MNLNHIKELIQTGEGLKTEFKLSITKSIAKEISAFANTKGGKIIVGINDDKQIKGIDYNDKNKRKLTNILRNNIEPSLPITMDYEHNILVINIPEADNKPCSANGKFYTRIGSISQRLPRDELLSIFQQENQIRFDERINKKFDIKADFSEKAFKLYLEKSKFSTDMSRQHLLENLYLKTGNKLNNAGVLFFCKDIRKFFLNATVVCVLYKGSSEVDILDRKEFSGDLLSNYHHTLNYIYSKLNTEYIIKKERTERLELPEAALREVMINAIVHRNYFSNAHIQVDIFHNRVEISNPGTLLFNKKYLGKKSVPRNPLLMDLLLRADYVEKIGSGIRRIKQAMANYDLNIEIDADEFFTVTFFRKEQIRSKFKTNPKQIQSKSDGNRTEIGRKSDATERRKWILQKLKREGKIKRIDIQNKFDIVKDTAHRDLKTLVENKKIVKKGTGRNVWYELSVKPKVEENRVTFDTLNDTQTEIIKIIKKKPEITYSELAKKVGKSRRTIIRNMKMLKQKGLVKRIGADKNGYWKVME